MIRVASYRYGPTPGSALPALIDRVDELIQLSEKARQLESITVKGEADVTLADDGAGIPAAEQSRVFESGYATSANGTGLGLTLIREIADAHGWSIDITDSSEGGARFEFRDVETGP